MYLCIFRLTPPTAPCHLSLPAAPPPNRGPCFPLPTPTPTTPSLRTVQKDCFKMQVRPSLYHGFKSLTDVTSVHPMKPTLLCMSWPHSLSTLALEVVPQHCSLFLRACQASPGLSAPHCCRRRPWLAKVASPSPPSQLPSGFFWTSRVAQTVESACNVGDLGLIPGLGRSLGVELSATPVFLPGESHGQRRLAG